jgi:hypothetical protein
MSAPRKGDRGTSKLLDGQTTGFTVSSVEGNLCFAVYDHQPGEKAQPFIWRFTDGLNTDHDWPGKAHGSALEAAA